MLKETVKNLIPSRVMQWRRRRIARRHQQAFAEKSVGEAFTEIYEKNVWGGKKGEFFSGAGSQEKYARLYAETVRNFISEKRIGTVVDLGCGDFRVSSQIVTEDVRYIGCDVVPSLIDHLNERHCSANIEFHCVNIVDDELPDGDLCLIRQVLQHLSNDEISKIIDRCRKYSFLIVTEQYPRPDKAIVPNLDIPHGPEVRLHFDSAVYLDEPPFGLRNVSVLLDVEAEEGTRIKSFLIRQ